MKQKYTDEYLRRIMEKMMPMVDEERRRNREVPVSGTRGAVHLSDRDIDYVFYTAKSANAPLLLGFHGGGFLWGGCALDDAMWSRTAEALDVNIASIEYRMSPEHQYMAAIEDAHDALMFFGNGNDPHDYDRDRIGVMGCSAGANLAASLCIYENRIGHKGLWKQILIYPLLDSATDSNVKSPGHKASPIEYIFTNLHIPADRLEDPLASPVFASEDDLRGTPDTILCYAEHDILRAEGIRYAKLLRAAGTRTAEMTAEGMEHIYFERAFGEMEQGQFMNLPEGQQELIRSGAMKKAGEETLAFIAANL